MDCMFETILLRSLFLLFRRCMLIWISYSSNFKSFPSNCVISLIIRTAHNTDSLLRMDFHPTFITSYNSFAGFLHKISAVHRNGKTAAKPIHFMAKSFLTQPPEICYTFSFNTTYTGFFLF